MENIVPLYIGEIVYPSSRGFFVAGYSLCMSLAQIWANGAIQGISHYTTEAGWLIICGQQFIPIIPIVLGVSKTLGPSSGTVVESDQQIDMVVPQLTPVAATERPTR